MRILGLKMTVMNVIILILALLGLLKVVGMAMALISGKKEHLFGGFKPGNAVNAIIQSPAFKAKLEMRKRQAAEAKERKAYKKCRASGKPLIGKTGCYCKYLGGHHCN
tara:strand:+ start:121 stop:444 length:324 start_codon:yes stop_codon:yes gene_type:complete